MEAPQRGEGYQGVDGKPAPPAAAAADVESGKEEEGGCGKQVDRWKDDFVSYLNEYRCRRADTRPEIDELIAKTIRENDVAMWVKSGCGFCERARGILKGEQEKYAFEFSDELGTDTDVRNSLQRICDAVDVHRGSITYPVIFVRGRYVGGSDDLAVLRDEGTLQAMMSAAVADPLQGTADDDYLEELRRPRLFEAARGRRCWLPHLYVYANLVRAVSLLHVIVFAVALTIHDDSERTVKYLMYVLIADLGLWTLWGPSPMSPTGLVLTALLWNRRGQSVTLIPYKVIFIYYFVHIVVELSSDDVPSKGLLTGFLINSSLLAVLRF